MTETEIQADILHGLRKMHIGFFWRNNNTGIYDKEKGIYRRPSKEFTMRGVSDILGCYNSKFTAIEVKTPDSYAKVMRLWQKIAKTGDVLLYHPESDYEQYIYNQILFITEVTHYGGIGFFTFSLEHTLQKLGA
jgi:hypothetical protein